MHLVHLLTSDTSGAFGAFSEFVVKTLDFSYIVQLVRFELTSDMSGAFGAFGAFLVKTIRFYLYCTHFTRALLVHLVHLVN